MTIKLPGTVAGRLHGQLRASFKPAQPARIKVNPVKTQCRPMHHSLNLKGTVRC